MIEVIRLVNSRFTSNTFILSYLDSENVWVIDPGDFTSIQKWMEVNNKIEIKGVLLTHTHFDHIYGINELFDKYPNITVYVNEAGIDALYDIKKNGSKYTDVPVSIDKRIAVEKMGESVLLWPDIYMQCFHTPGHSEDSMCMLVEGKLFTGDTLIKGIRTVTKVKGGSVEKLMQSMSWLKTLKGNGYWIYGGHEDIFELDGYDLSIAVTNKLVTDVAKSSL